MNHQPPTPHADHRLVEALLQNDRKGIEEIYARFSIKILRFVKQNSGSEDDARDVFQESLIAITQQARAGKLILTCPFDAFLYLVSRAKWLNELRRRRRQAVTIHETEVFSEKHEAASLFDIFEQEETKSRLFQTAFENLSAGCRQLLELSWSGQPMEKVAAALGFTYGYARKKKSECIEKLTSLVKQLPDYQSLSF